MNLPVGKGRFLLALASGHHRALVKYFFGMLAIVALVAGATVGAYRAWDRATHTRESDSGVLTGDVGPTSTLPPDAPAPAEGQVLVTGTITSAHFEGAIPGQLNTPITVTTAERGAGGATITPVLVNGTSTSIEWLPSGAPLPLESDAGNLALDPVTVDVTDAITMLLDGVHGFAPGTYKIGTSVAVGSTPRDSVTFIATDQSTISFRGTASTTVDSLSTWGSGNLTLHGALTVAHPDRTTTSTSVISLHNGAYRIDVTPVEGGFSVTALLIGPTQ